MRWISILYTRTGRDVLHCQGPRKQKRTVILRGNPLDKYWFQILNMVLDEGTACSVVLGLRLKVPWLWLTILRCSILSWGRGSAFCSHLLLDCLSLLVLPDGAVVFCPLCTIVAGRCCCYWWCSSSALLLYKLCLLGHTQRPVVLGPLGRVVWLSGGYLARGVVVSWLRLSIVLLVSASMSSTISTTSATSSTNLFTYHLF